jgi:hypothetical protein
MIMQQEHKVLFAIYTEQNRPFPDMGRVTPQLLRMDVTQFKVAVDKLCEDCLIRGAVIIGEEDWPIPRAVFLDNARLTESGTRYICDMLKKAI